MGRDRLADRVVEEQAVVAQLHEREAQQAVERVLRRGVGEHRRQQRHGRPANHGRRVQRLPGHRIEPVEVELRELGDDRLDGDGLDVHVGAVLQRRGREPQRERVPPSEAVDPFGVGGVDPRLAQQGLGLGARQPAEWEVPEQRAERALPAGHRRLAAGQDHPDAVAQRRDERPLQPRVEQAEDLVGVEHEHDALTEAVEPGRRLGRAGRGDARRVRQRRQEPPLRWLDRPAVEVEHRRATVAGLVRERLDERRLAHAREAVDEDDQWTIGRRAAPWRTSRSSSRPTSPAARSSMSCRTVTVISGVCARCQSGGDGGRAMGHGGRTVQDREVAGGDVGEMGIRDEALEQVGVGERRPSPGGRAMCRRRRRCCSASSASQVFETSPGRAAKAGARLSQTSRYSRSVIASRWKLTIWTCTTLSRFAEWTRPP